MARMAQTAEPARRPPRPTTAPTESDAGRAPRRHFERAPSVIITLVLLVLIASATVRLYELQRPNTLVFDETYYAKDAHTILHGYPRAHVTYYPWEPGKEISWPHPEYGKYAIAVGEAGFGDTSFGWRIMSAIAGLLLLALVYPLGRRLGLAPVWALLGLVLAASDFLGIVQSRIATLDIFIAFWSVLCIYLALRYVQSGHRLRWLVLCGVAGGLALGTKWSGGFAWWRPWPSSCSTGGARGGARCPRGAARPARRRAARLALVVLPVALYVASYADYFTKGHHTLSQWWALQHEMWWFNENLHATHTYASQRLHLDLRLPPGLVLLRAGPRRRARHHLDRQPAALVGFGAGARRPRRAGRPAARPRAGAAAADRGPALPARGSQPRAPRSCTT